MTPKTGFYLLIAILIFLFGVTFFQGCKSEWRKAEPVMAGLPNDMPPKYQSPKGVNVYSNRRPTSLELQLIDVGISNQLSRSLRPNPNFTDPNSYQTWKRFKNHSEYNVFLADTNEKSILPETLDCPILLTYSGYAAGVLMGVQFRNNQADGTQWIIVPKLTNTEARCQTLFRDGVDHESEHQILMNDSNLFWAYFGANDIHPIFPK